MNIIDNFHGEFKFLSNFAEAKLIVGNKEYRTLEHAYQALKTTYWWERAEVRKQSTPGKAKRAGRKLTIRPNWDNLKIEFMLKLLKQKFSKPEFRHLLINTGDAQLIESNHWHDNYWGVCKCGQCQDKIGNNVLGKSLMQVRDLLNKGEL